MGKNIKRSNHISIFCCMILLSANIVLANIGIQPAYVEVQLDKGRPAGRFLISNLGDQEERFRIQSLHFTYSPEGALSQSKTGENSMAPWIIFNPKELTLPPQSQRAVRFAIIPRGVLQEGEYWAAMELESLKLTETVSQDGTGKSVRLRVISAIQVPMFGTMGKVDYKGWVDELNVVSLEDGTYLKSMVVNTGTGRLGVNAKYQIRDLSGELLEEDVLGRAYILRGAKRIFSKKIVADLPKGSYIVKVICNAAHLEKPLTREIQFDWIPRPKQESTTKPSSDHLPKQKPIDNSAGKAQLAKSDPSGH